MLDELMFCSRILSVGAKSGTVLYQIHTLNLLHSLLQIQLSRNMRCACFSCPNHAVFQELKTPTPAGARLRNAGSWPRGSPCATARSVRASPSPPRRLAAGDPRSGTRRPLPARGRTCLQWWRSDASGPAPAPPGSCTARPRWAAGEPARNNQKSHHSNPALVFTICKRQATQEDKNDCCEPARVEPIQHGTRLSQHYQRQATQETNSNTW